MDAPNRAVSTIFQDDRPSPLHPMAPAALARLSFAARLRPRVAAFMLLAMMGAIFCTLWIAEQGARTSARAAALQHSNDLAALLTQQVAASLSRDGYRHAESLLQGLAAHPDIVHARLVDPLGVAIAQYGAASGTGTDTLVLRRDVTITGAPAGYLDLTFNVSRQLRESAFHSERTALRLSTAIVAAFLLTYVGLMWMLRHSPPRGDEPLPYLGMHTAPLAMRETGDAATPLPGARPPDHGIHDSDWPRHAHSRARSGTRDDARSESDEASLPAPGAQELALDAVTDPVTGLYGRRYVERLLQVEIVPALRREETHSILLVAVDAGTRVFADAAHAPDDVMREIARRLTPLLRQHDTLCRHGDHLFLLCRGATMATAVTIAAHLQNTITAEPVTLGARTLPVALRIGVATVPGRQTVRTPQEFLRCAEEALQHAHDMGQNGIAHFSLLSLSRSTAARA